MFDENHAERIDDPGAKMSTHVPKLENDERASVLVVEPVVMALAARDGEELQAFALLLPAATAIVTPRKIGRRKNQRVGPMAGPTKKRTNR